LTTKQVAEKHGVGWKLVRLMQMAEAEGKGLSVEQWSNAAVELGLLPTARPMVTFLMLGLGFSEGELEKLLDRREELLSIRVERARSRAAFLLDIGLSQEDVRKVGTLLLHRAIITPGSTAALYGAPDAPGSVCCACTGLVPTGCGDDRVCMPPPLFCCFQSRSPALCLRSGIC
jgi:hypothetical protein